MARWIVSASRQPALASAAASEMPGAAVRVGSLAGPDRPHGAGTASSGGKPLQVGSVQLLPVECYRHGQPLDPRQLGWDFDHIGEPRRMPERRATGSAMPGPGSGRPYSAVPPG